MKKYDFSYGNHRANLHRIDCISQDEEEEEKKTRREKEMGKPQMLVLLVFYPTNSIEIVILYNLYLC
jgi:hypothetical protein